MPRLGELLVAARLLDADKLEQALRAQVVWGGRLGTNLIELGFIDLDELSRQLGKQHNLPAALARHFEKADPELQKELPTDLAHRYSFVPLLRLADHKIAVAGMDPLGPQALAEIAEALFCLPGDLVCSVAAEQRMRYQLERVYGITRGARYLRSRGSTIPPFPRFDDFTVEADSEVDAVVPAGDDLEIPIEWEDTPEPQPAVSRASTDALAALIEDAATQAKSSIEPVGRERRTYVRTLADTDPPATRPVEPDKKALGRIAIRKVAVAAGSTPAGGTPTNPATTLAEMARAIRRGGQRDRVAELVIDALERFAPTCQAGVLLVIRGTTATGWKGFSRSGTVSPELAVPLDEPGLISRAVERTATVRGKLAELGAVDAKLLRALDRGAGELAIVPVAIAGRVLCVIAAATEPGAAIPNVETIATSAGTAFARIMRDTGR